MAHIVIGLERDRGASRDVGGARQGSLIGGFVTPDCLGGDIRNLWGY